MSTVEDEFVNDFGICNMLNVYVLCHYLRIIVEALIFLSGVSIYLSLR